MTSDARLLTLSMLFLGACGSAQGNQTSRPVDHSAASNPAASSHGMDSSRKAEVGVLSNDSPPVFRLYQCPERTPAKSIYSVAVERLEKDKDVMVCALVWRHGPELGSDWVYGEVPSGYGGECNPLTPGSRYRIGAFGLASGTGVLFFDVQRNGSIKVVSGFRCSAS